MNQENSKEVLYDKHDFLEIFNTKPSNTEWSLDLFVSSRIDYLLLVIALLCLAFNARAARVPGLYEAMVPVASQSPSLRNQALREALRRVVIKVTGTMDLSAYFYSNSLATGSLVEQFGYESTKQGGERQLFLWAKLNPEGVQKIIREQGLPIWPEERPATLIWLAIEDKAGREIIAEGSGHEIVAVLKEAAAQRGMPIIMPLMDLTESASIDFIQVAGMGGQVLARASERYASQYVLVGYLLEQEGLWQGRWQSAGEQQPATVAIGSLEDVVSAGINPLANRIARQFSGFAPGDSPQYIEIIIDDIRDAADYGRSLAYLRSISLVNQADVTRMDPQGVSFRLHTHTDIASVLRVIDLDRVLYARDTVDRLVFGLNPQGLQ